MRGKTKVADYKKGNSLVINGQLILTQLIIELEHYIVLLQVNTDGIIFNYRKKDYSIIIKIIRDFENRFSLGFKCENISYFYQRNVSNYIMVKEPLESVAPDDIRCWLNENYNEYNLAVAFADTHNKVGWLMHNSDEDYAVSVLVDKWYECYIQLFNMILKILTD